MKPERKEEIRKKLAEERLACVKCGYRSSHPNHGWTHKYERPVRIEDELIIALDEAEKEQLAIYDDVVIPMERKLKVAHEVVEAARKFFEAEYPEFFDDIDLLEAIKRYDEAVKK